MSLDSTMQWILENALQILMWSFSGIIGTIIFWYIVSRKKHDEFQKYVKRGKLNVFIEKGEYLLKSGNFDRREVPYQELVEAKSFGLITIPKALKVLADYYELTEHGKEFLRWCVLNGLSKPASDYEAKTININLDEPAPPPSLTPDEVEKERFFVPKRD